MAALPGSHSRSIGYNLNMLKPKLLRERAILNSLDDVGITEKGGNNRGRDVERIIKANGGVVGEPWCGDAVAAWYLEAGSKSVTRSWASVSALSRLLTRIKLLNNVRRGHVVIYDFDHTGLFLRWVDKGKGIFEAVEGNTGDSGAVSDSKTGGDGVKIKQRNLSQVTHFYRVLR